MPSSASSIRSLTSRQRASFSADLLSQEFISRILTLSFSGKHVERPSGPQRSAVAGNGRYPVPLDEAKPATTEDDRACWVALARGGCPRGGLARRSAHLAASRHRGLRKYPRRFAVTGKSDLSSGCVARSAAEDE